MRGDSGVLRSCLDAISYGRCDPCGIRPTKITESDITEVQTTGISDGLEQREVRYLFQQPDMAAVVPL